MDTSCNFRFAVLNPCNRSRIRITLIGRNNDLGGSTEDYKIIGTERRWGGSSTIWRGQFETVMGYEGKFGIATTYKEPFGTNRENGV